MIRAASFLLMVLAAPAAADTLPYLERLCDEGDWKGCAAAAAIAEKRGDDDHAAQLTVKGCDLGASQSCAQKGMLLLRGKGFEKDVAAAAPLLQLGCIEGHPRACEDAGWMQETGTGLPQSYDKAAWYYTRGCDAKSGHSCARLAQLYGSGKVWSPVGTAERLQNRACALGHRPAC